MLYYEICIYWRRIVLKTGTWFGKPNGIVTVKIGGICFRDLSIMDQLSRTKYVENRMDEHVKHVTHAACVKKMKVVIWYVNLMISVRVKSFKVGRVFAMAIRQKFRMRQTTIRKMRPTLV